jgi:hypothetical protein
LGTGVALVSSFLKDLLRIKCLPSLSKVATIALAPSTWVVWIGTPCLCPYGSFWLTQETATWGMNWLVGRTSEKARGGYHRSVFPGPGTATESRLTQLSAPAEPQPGFRCRPPALPPPCSVLRLCVRHPASFFPFLTVCSAPHPGSRIVTAVHSWRTPALRALHSVCFRPTYHPFPLSLCRQQMCPHHRPFSSQALCTGK